jgi:hypothetical protein
MGLFWKKCSATADQVVSRTFRRSGRDVTTCSADVVNNFVTKAGDLVSDATSSTQDRNKTRELILHVYSFTLSASSCLI